MIGDREVIQLAGHEYVVRAVPIGKLRKLAKDLSNVLASLTSSGAQTTEQAIEEVVGGLGAGLDTFFRAFAPEIPAGLFDDEENGPTLPEIVEAVKVIAKVNRLDSLGNLLRPLGQALQGAVSPLSK